MRSIERIFPMTLTDP